MRRVQRMAGGGGVLYCLADCCPLYGVEVLLCCLTYCRLIVHIPYRNAHPLAAPGHPLAHGQGPPQGDAPQDGVVPRGQAHRAADSADGAVPVSRRIRIGVFAVQTVFILSTTFHHTMSHTSHTSHTRHKTHPAIHPTQQTTNHPIAPQPPATGGAQRRPLRQRRLCYSRRRCQGRRRRGAV
jgi:hypothetical protein